MRLPLSTSPPTSKSTYSVYLIFALLCLISCSNALSPPSARGPDDPLPKTAGFSIDPIEPGYPTFFAKYSTKPDPAYDQAYSRLTTGPPSWRAFPPNNSYRVPLSVYREIYDLFGFEVNEPVPTPVPLRTSDYTGQSLHECYTNPQTPPGVLKKCEAVQMMAALEVVKLTESELSTLPLQRRVALDQVIQELDALHDDVSHTLNVIRADNLDASTFCPSILPGHRLRLNSLTASREGNPDFDLLYVNHRLAFLSSYVTTMNEACARPA